MKSICESIGRWWMGYIDGEFALTFNYEWQAKAWLKGDYNPKYGGE